MSTSEYSQTKLFGPLGIKAADVSWATDPQGIAIGGYGISMRPHDMAKLGLLLESNGKWDGNQVVPSDWVSAATREQVRVEGDKDYGYLFWVYPTAFAAEGTAQQRITVVPMKNLIGVMTRQVGSKERPCQALITDYIFTAVMSDQALDPNSAAKAILQARVDELANPFKPVSLLR